MRITNGTNSPQALQLHFASLDCGPEATMTGDRSFSVVKTSCPLLDLTGTRVGQALPGTQERALENTDSEATPTAVLQRLVQTARR